MGINSMKRAARVELSKSQKDRGRRSRRGRQDQDREPVTMVESTTPATIDIDE